MIIISVILPVISYKRSCINAVLMSPLHRMRRGKLYKAPDTFPRFAHAPCKLLRPQPTDWPACAASTLVTNWAGWLVVGLDVRLTR